MRTAEQIATIAAERATTELGRIRIINAHYRKQDDSHLWPIRGRFNVTERAIRRVRAFMRDYGSMSGLEYCYALETQQSEIVNNEDNW